MSLEQPRYPKLWMRQAETGETEGRQSRPVAVGVRIARPNCEDVLVLFRITSQPPAPDRFAAEIPEMEKRRGGLNSSLRFWIILDDYNQDTIGRSFYLEPEPPIGRFRKAFFLPLMKEFIASRADARGVNADVKRCGLSDIRFSLSVGRSARSGRAAHIDLEGAADFHAGVGALDLDEAGAKRGTGIAGSALRRRKPVRGRRGVQSRMAG